MDSYTYSFGDGTSPARPAGTVRYGRGTTSGWCVSPGSTTTAGATATVQIRLPGARNSDDLDDGCAGVPAKV